MQRECEPPACPGPDGAGGIGESRLAGCEVFLNRDIASRPFPTDNGI